MDYVVTAGLKPPVDVPDLDGLRQEGVTALLDRQLSQVEGVTGPQGRDIDVLDYRITTHPDGVTVMLALDSPTLISAEEAAATVLDELLNESDLLTGWSVSESQVRITEDEFNQSLAAADGGPTEPAGEDSALEAAVDEVLEGSTDIGPLDTEHWRTKLTELADQLQAVELDTFDDPRDLRLAAGALIQAVRVVTDEIFYDEMALAINNATVADAVGLLVLEDLPAYYQPQYDSQFARAFLLASASVARRLTQPEWTPPGCVAEALALRLFVNEARVLLEAAKLMSWEASEPIFEAFSRRAFAYRDHGDLYELAEPQDKDMVNLVETGLHARGLAFEQWFQQEPGDGMHPYHQAM